MFSKVGEKLVDRLAVAWPTGFYPGRERLGSICMALVAFEPKPLT